MTTKSLRGWLELVRLPGVVTAAADSLAGYMLTEGRWGDSYQRPVALASASMLLYAAGMALNDVADHAIDQVERPGRPIPSGRVNRSQAALVAALGLAIGPVVAYQGCGIASALAALALAACVVAYNLLLKHTPLGPLAMGACRGLNLFMGLTFTVGFGYASDQSLAIAFGLFVVGITVISRSEVAGGSIWDLVLGLTLEIAALMGLGALVLSPRHADRPLDVALGAAVLAGVALMQLAAGSTAIRAPEPKNVQKLVRTGVLSLVFIDMALVTAAWGPLTAAPLAGLWVVSFLLARRLYAT